MLTGQAWNILLIPEAFSSAKFTHSKPEQLCLLDTDSSQTKPFVVQWSFCESVVFGP